MNDPMDEFSLSPEPGCDYTRVVYSPYGIIAYRFTVLNVSAAGIICYDYRCERNGQLAAEADHMHMNIADWYLLTTGQIDWPSQKPWEHLN